MPDVIDSAGLQVATAEEIREAIRTAIRASPQFSSDANLEADSVLGQIIDPVVAQLDDSRQLLLAVYNAYDPDNSEGIQLDNIAGLSGTVREPATKTTFTAELAGTPTTLITAGSRVKLQNVDNSDALLDADVTIGGGGTIDGEFTTENTGPINYPDTTVLDIVTPIAGWDTATVSGDPSLGRNVELDSELRLRKEDSFAIGGSATDQSMAAIVRQLPDVDHAVVISNRSLVTDAKGIPGKSGRLVIFPTTVDGDRVVSTIFAVWPAGIESDGSEEFTVIDTEGQEHIFRFSFAVEKDIWVEVDVTVENASLYGGDSAVKQAILDYGAGLDPGDDAAPIDIICRINADVAGIAHLVVRIGLAASPTGTIPVPIDVDEIALFDIARITVAS